MARSTDDAPRSADQRDGAPHPRLAHGLVGQGAAERAFLTALNADKLHSGWLLTGPEGVGKATLAYRIAAFLLADPPGGMFGPPTSLDLPANDPELRLIHAGSHPRLFVLRRALNPDTNRNRDQITVDDARELRRFFGLSAADGGRRVVIIDAADDLNPSAANAILKLLEEPPALATLLLIAHQPSRLLPTIRSRCRTLTLHPLTAPDLAQALTAIGITPEAPDALAALAGGSVGQAVRLLRQDGLALYAEIVRLMSALPRIDRPATLKLAEAAGARGADERFGLTIDLTQIFLARTARAGLIGEPTTQGASGEARLLARLAPDDHAAQGWAEAAQSVAQRARAGRAVNLDPASLILDMVLSIEQTAKTIAAR